MAYDFDGANDRIDNTVAEAVTGIDAATISVLVWYKRDDAPATDTLWFLGTSPTSGGIRGFTHLATGRIRFRQEWASSADWSIDDVSQNVWHSILVVYDGSLASNNPVIYVDGSSVTVTTDSAPSGSRQTGADNISIGETMAGGADLDGTLAEFAFWDALLTQGEASELAASYSPKFIRPANRILYIPLVREVVELEQGLALTLVGATVADHPPIIYPATPQIITAPVAAGKGVGPFTKLSVMATPGMIHSFLAKDPAGAPVDVFFENRHPITQGMKPSTAAGLGGILIDD